VIEVETGYYAWTGDFNLIVEGIVNSRARNEIIRRMVHTHGRYPQLILTSRVSHAQLLAQMIPDSEVVVGSTKKRDEVFQSVRDGKTKVLIATQLADEGLDLPSLTAVHMTTPSRSSGRVVQRVGRVMRMAPGKQEAVVYDYCDDMGVLQSQRRARFAAYRSEISGVKFSRTDMSHVMHEQL
jgi:superfamily II DNA or RNA helicase